MLLQAPVDRFLRPVCPEIWLLVGKIRKRTQSNIKAWYEYQSKFFEISFNQQIESKLKLASRKKSLANQE